MPVYAIEDNKLVLKDGRVALGFRVEGVEMEQWTAAQYQNFNACFAGALKPLPMGTVVQKMDIFYDHAYKRENKDQAYFQSKTDGHFMDRLMLFHNSYLFVSFPPEKPVKSSPVNNLFAQLGKRVLENPFAGIEKRLEAAEGQGTELAASLEVCPHLDAVLSSKPVERNYLRQLVRHYQGKIHFAVNQYVEDKAMKKGPFL